MNLLCKSLENKIISITGGAVNRGYEIMKSFQI